MLQVLGLLSGLVSVVAYIPYIKDILRGSTQPERASWLIWSVLGSIALFSQLADGATYSIWLTVVQTFGVMVIFALSLRFGVGGLACRDLMALAAAGVGLILWYLTNEPVVALLIAIAIDGIGGLLTVVKSYEDPDSETLSTWLLAGIAGILAMISVGNLDKTLLAYPFYIFAINGLVVAAILAGRRARACAHKG